MTAIKHQLLKWIVAGVAFAAAEAVTGCGSSHPAAPVAAKPAVTISDEPLTAPVGSALAGNPGQVRSPARPLVNVFGEFDGVERPNRPVGEAGFQQRTFLEEGYDSAIQVDPTGKWMVFASTRHSEHPKIYLQRTDGTSVTQLTSDASDDAYPTFSPDGKRLAFSSTRGGTWNLFLMDADGRNIMQVTNGPTQDLHPSFSPDGTRLAYCSLGMRSGQWELWVVNLLSGEKRMIGYGLFPSWSPGREMDRIAFQRARARGSRWFSLWTLDLVDGEARRVTEVAVSANAAIVSPAWSPDGHHLVFQTIVGPAVNVPDKSNSQQDIWTVDVDGRNRHRLTDGNGSNLTPCWAVDNQVYFISDRGGAECVWSVQAAPEPPAAPVAASGKGDSKPTAAVGAADPHEITH